MFSTPLVILDRKSKAWLLTLVVKLSSCYRRVVWSTSISRNFPHVKVSWKPQRLSLSVSKTFNSLCESRKGHIQGKISLYACLEFMSNESLVRETWMINKRAHFLPRILEFSELMCLSAHDEGTLLSKFR